MPIKLIVILIVICIFIFSVANLTRKGRRMARWTLNPDPNVKYFIPVKGFNCFLGLRNDAVLSEGNWYRGYNGVIPFEKITEMEFINSKTPRLVINFIDEHGTARTVRYASISPYRVSEDVYRRNFILLCESAVAYWKVSKRKQ